MKDNNSQNNNTSNAIANEALQKKSEGASLEPPKKYSISSILNRPVQKVENEELIEGALSESPKNNAEQSEKAKANFGKLRGKVIGNTKRVARDVAKAGVSPEIMEEAEKQTRIKRLVGGDWQQEKEWVIGPDGKRVAGEKASKHTLSDEEKDGLEKKYTHESAVAAFGEDKVKNHLDQFPQAHAWISEWAFTNIVSRAWKGWGAGSNFVTPLGVGDALFSAAKIGEGIATLEKKLGVPEGNWSNKGATNTIYRFIVKNPKALKIRMPMGKEGGAYQNEWVFGGKTLDGTMEAIVDSLTYEELVGSVGTGALIILKVSFDGENTTEENVSL